MGSDPLVLGPAEEAGSQPVTTLVGTPDNLGTKFDGVVSIEYCLGELRNDSGTPSRGYFTAGILFGGHIAPVTEIFPTPF